MAVPSAPTLRALGTGQGSVRISVDPVAGTILSYAIYRSTNAAFSDEAVLTADAEVRPDWYFDITALEGMTHWYRATATNADGESLKSAEKHVTVTTNWGGIDPTDALRHNRHCF